MFTQSVAGAFDMDDYRFMQQSVQERGGNHQVAENGASLVEVAVGSQDDGGFLVACRSIFTPSQASQGIRNGAATVQAQPSSRTGRYRL